MRRFIWVALGLWAAGECFIPHVAQAQGLVKKSSTLYPAEVVAQMRATTDAQPWAGALREGVIEAAAPWMAMSDDELWALMFGPTITRSWMVWSNGFCPACKQSVPMYNWEMDAIETPWKVWCPHCEQHFPTNDFEAFHRSGLDAHGVFDPAKADRSLLFNAEHPGADDPLRLFGVEDGEGYVEGENRWRFIGAYLIYGQWKEAIVAGVRVLAAAHLITGETAYAHKAGVLLDRVADLYPTFDFGKTALVYERKGDRGYVSTWHDACEETRELAMAYDMIFEALKEDDALPKFLSDKARQHGLENPKATFEDIQRNIEDRILLDSIKNRSKITTNYPRTEIAVAIMLSVLGWPENKEAFYKEVDGMLVRATAVDGVTGEKGLAGYTSFTIQALAMFLAEYSKADPAFLKDLLERHPRLKETYRFHIDTLCLDRYYPLSGDTGGFAMKMPAYKGMNFMPRGFSGKKSAYWTFLPPSCYTLLWRFYELTGDAAYVQIAHRGNGRTLEGIPHDLYAADPSAIREGMAGVIAGEGAELRLDSVNKEQWRIGILRSGEGGNARAAWLDYDSGGGHGHADGMNLGLFARGLDLLPEFGYPPVQFGGWGSPRARWYTMTAAHNTVVVDGANTTKGGGATTLWVEGSNLKAIRVAAPALNGGRRYERTVLLVDLSPEDCYVVDVFRVAGGKDHTKFLHSSFGTVATAGLALENADDYGHGTQMRNVKLDPNPEPGWSVDWAVEDRYGYVAEKQDTHLRYTDFTSGAAAGLAEAWIVAGMFDSSEEVWIPRVLVRRSAEGDAELASTFAGVVEPYGETRAIAGMRRLPVTSDAGNGLSDSHVGLEIAHADGTRDLILLRDPEDGAGTARLGADGALESDAEVVLVRTAPDGAVRYAALAKGSAMTHGGETLVEGQAQEFWESVR